jgi:hypothetical protein
MLWLVGNGIGCIGGVDMSVLWILMVVVVIGFLFLVLWFASRKTFRVNVVLVRGLDDLGKDAIPVLMKEPKLFYGGYGCGGESVFEVGKVGVEQDLGVEVKIVDGLGVVGVGNEIYLLGVVGDVRGNWVELCDSLCNELVLGLVVMAWRRTLGK